MELEIFLERPLHDSASDYYDRAKKARKKVEGAKKALERSRLELAKAKLAEQPQHLEKRRERQWFEKFHWLRTRNGLLAIAGRDAKANEFVVKKHLNAGDLFFHADIQGAAATVLIDGQAAKPEDRQDAARLAAVFSKAWNAGIGAIDVFCAKPGQVKTAAKAGESLAQGSFVIEGKREWLKDVPLEIRATIIDGVPQLSTADGTRLVPGKGEKSALAKKMRAKLGGALDDWLSVLPQGGEIK